jgi:DNA-binding MarR family transcriptional regulator
MVVNNHLSEDRAEYRAGVGDTQAASELDGDVDRIARALRHTWHALARTGVPTKALEGIQRQGYWVLSGLMCGPKRMSDIAETTGISSANLTGIVDRLEERELAERVRSAEDRRVVTVRITEFGRQEMLEAHRNLTTRLTDLLDPLTESERSELLRLLTKLTAPKEA